MNAIITKLPEPTLRASVPVLKGGTVWHAVTPHYECPANAPQRKRIVTVLDDEGEIVWLSTLRQSPLAGAVALQRALGDDVEIEEEYCLHPGYPIHRHFAPPNLRIDAHTSDVYLCESPLEERVWVTVTDSDGRKRKVRGAPRLAVITSYRESRPEMRIALCDFIVVVASENDEPDEDEFVDVYGTGPDGGDFDPVFDDVYHGFYDDVPETGYEVAWYGDFYSDVVDGDPI